MIGCQIITNRDKIFRYREAWNQLFDSGEHEPSASFEWTHALLETHLKEKDIFLLIVLKDSEKIVGLVPLILSETRKYAQSLFNLFPISEYYNTHSDFLFRDLSDELIKAFMTSLFSLGYRWDVFRMGRFIEPNPILDHIEHHLRKINAKHQIKKEEPSFFLTLGDSFEDYLKKRSGKFRNYLKRMGKKLRAKGHIEFLNLKDYRSGSDAYRQLLQVEEKSWKHNHGTAISSIKKQKDFYERLCITSYERGRLHLFFLYLNDKSIAYDMGLVKDRKYFYLKTSFDEEYRRLSPSTILRAKLVEQLILDGVKYFDFPGEPYEWERQWAEELRWHKSLLIYNDTLKGRILSMFHGITRKLTSQNDQDQLQYHDPRELKPEKG